jgi:hypothetical protein
VTGVGRVRGTGRLPGLVPGAVTAL